MPCAGRAASLQPNRFAVSIASDGGGFMRRLLVLSLLLLSGFSAAADGADKYNFRFSPVGLIVGSINVNMDFKISDEWTIGPQLEYWHFTLGSDDVLLTSDYNITAIGGGIRANWFPNGVYTSGLYVGPSVSYTSVKLTTSDKYGSVTGSVGAPLVSCLVGYAWFWSSFNIMLGGGLSTSIGETQVKVTDSSGTTVSVSDNLTGLDIEFSLGWTF
jgi:hypothetical protein